MINFFLGWSIIGWIVALAMAVGKDADKTIVVKNEGHTTTANELEKLSELKEKGVLTQEEFEKEKKKILEK